jgi:hypothetical protein
MRHPIGWVACATLWLAGCAVTDEKYPAAWDPLPPSMSADCAHFAGSYADRGELRDAQTPPSLTYGLFGHHAPWQSARRVDFAFAQPGTLEITAWGEHKPLLKRTLVSKADEFACKDGRLIVHQKRWVAADLVAGREEVTLEFSDAGTQLVAHVKESTYGAIFAVVPIAGTAAHWYRFRRLAP